MWGYDLNYYTIAYLGHMVPIEMAALRGVAQLGAVSVAMRAGGAAQGDRTGRGGAQHGRSAA